MDTSTFQLFSDRLWLRSYAPEDISALYEAARESIAHLNPWMPWCHPSYSLQDSAQWLAHTLATWARATEYNFAIFDRASNRFLGGCGVNKIDAEYLSANLGYWIRRTELKKGIATEATRLVAKFAFDVLKLNRVEIVVAEQNTPSQRTALRAGALQEGVLRKRLFLHGIPHDAVMFSLIAEDLR